MTKFVLEILDGDRAGTVVPLGEGQVKIGRRPDNDVVLPDEKCSGHHAVVEFDGGRHVLRDLDSTNGTTLDGHRVQEIVLTPGDVVQFGRIRACFRAEGERAGMDDLRVQRVDASRLRGGHRRRSTVLLIVLIVVAVGVGAWLAFGRGLGRSGTVGPRVVTPLEVEGNLLPAAVASVESDEGWDLQAVPQAVPFDLAIGRAGAHSGSGALLAVRATGEDAQAGFALARLAEPLAVTSGTALEVAAFVRTAGQGRAAVRVHFGSSADDRSICTGTAPIESTADWQRVSLSVRAPAGLDRVRVELLALLPGEGAEVSVDDFALVRVPDAPALAGDTRNGRVLIGAGSSFRIDGTAEPTLLAVVPLVADPALEALAAAGELTPSDAGLGLSLEPMDGAGFRVRYGGDAAIRGLRVVFPPDAALVRTRESGEATSFVERSPEFDADGVIEVLLGAVEGRCLLEFEQPLSIRGQMLADAYALDLIDCRGFQLDTVFAEAVRRARDLEREARLARSEGRAGDALRVIRELVDQVPYDVGLVRAAQTLRSEILTEQEQRIRELERDAVSAAFFDSRLGYERVIAGIDELIGYYGEQEVQRQDDLRALRERMAQGIAALDRRAGAAHAEQLAGLAAAFESAGDEKLANVLRDYVKRHYASLNEEEK